MLIAKHIMGTVRLHNKMNDSPAGWSNIFDTYHPLHNNNDRTNHDTTGLDVTIGGVVNWKSTQLQLTAQSTTELTNWP